MKLTLAIGTITASEERRTLAGPGVRFGVYGRTDAGLLKVRDASSLTYPANLAEVILTKEHDRNQPRGVLASLAHTDAATWLKFKADAGPDGDDAIREAKDGTRAGMSFDIVDAVVVGDEIVAGRVVAFGQVETPAYVGAFFESIAASAAPNPTTGAPMFTPEMAARLIELQAKETLTDAEKAELSALKAMAEVYPPTTADAPADPAVVAPVVTAAAVPVSAMTAAAVPAVAGGVPPIQSGAQRSGTTTHDRAQGAQFWRPGDLQRFIDTIRTASVGGAREITAALSDITYATHGGIIQPPAWSGELWSGVEYQPIWTDLFSQGELTNLEGKGWRFTQKIVIADYAGNKVAIPSSLPTTEPASYTAARMATGNDIDRAYYDFNTPENQAFLAALPFQARESWAMKLDGKIRAYALAQAIPAEGVDPQPTLIKAAAVAVRALRRRQVIGRNASTWVVVNDDDLFSLLDYNTLTLPEFLQLFGISPDQFRSDQLVPAGTVVAGARQAAEVMTLPGSPIRVDAQHIASGGVDEAFFGYWGIQEHHPSGIASAEYAAIA